MSKTEYMSCFPGKQCTMCPCPHECTCPHMCLYTATNAHVTCAFSNGPRSSSCVLTDRCMMERTPHPASLATLRAAACWVMWSTVHPIACGWSSTAMPPEPIRASASCTQVSCLRDELGTWILQFQLWFIQVLPANKSVAPFHSQSCVLCPRTTAKSHFLLFEYSS